MNERCNHHSDCARADEKHPGLGHCHEPACDSSTAESCPRVQRPRPPVPLSLATLEYVDLERDMETGRRFDEPRWFTLSWGFRSFGFGTFSFSKRSMWTPPQAGLYCGNEYMRLETVRLVVQAYCDKTPREQWPELLRAYADVDALMADVQDWESKASEERSREEQPSEERQAPP